MPQAVNGVHDHTTASTFADYRYYSALANHALSHMRIQFRFVQAEIELQPTNSLKLCSSQRPESRIVTLISQNIDRTQFPLAESRHAVGQQKRQEGEKGRGT